MLFRTSMLALGLVVAGALPASAAPGEEIGSALVVVNQVTAELSRDVRTLSAGDRLRHSELIVAGNNARTELKLDDDTKLALGPGARLLLDKFVYDPHGANNSILVNLAKGSFRFLTGVAAKPSYLIRTPTAAITVRGTVFDVFVRESGESWLLLDHGGVEVCTLSGSCRMHSEPGKIIRISGDEEIAAPFCWAQYGREPGFSFAEAFPFVSSPPTVDPQPVFTEAVLTSETDCMQAPKQRRAEASPEPDEPAATKATAPRAKKLKVAGPVKKTKIVRAKSPVVTDSGTVVTGSIGTRVTLKDRIKDGLKGRRIVVDRLRQPQTGGSLVSKGQTMIGKLRSFQPKAGPTLNVSKFTSARMAPNLR